MLGTGSRATLVCGRRADGLLLLAGEPIGEPVARYGAFAITTQDEIRRAIDDFAAEP